MARNEKKGTITHGKPITDFFTLASKPHPKSRVSPSMSSQASPSQDIIATRASEITETLNKSKVASIVSKPPINSSSEPHSRQFLDGSSTKTRPLFASSAPTSSLKRVRSPDFQAHARASAPHNKRALSDTVKTPDRRRDIFDSDSDIEMPNTVIYVNSTVCHSSMSQWLAYSDSLLAQSERK